MDKSKIQVQNNLFLSRFFWFIVFVCKSTIVCSNGGRNLCTKGGFLNVKYILSLYFDFLLILPWEFLSSCLHSIKGDGLQNS